MLFGEPIGGLQLVVLGLFVLTVAWMVRRSIGLRRRGRSPHPSAAFRDEIRPAQDAESRIRELEVRLYDYERDVEGRIETRLTLLDRLIEEADREIDHLQHLLERRGGTDVDPPADRGPDILGFPQLRKRHEMPADGAGPVTAEDRRMIRHLREAGYSVGQIARLVERPESDVRAVLEGPSGPDHRDAA